MNQALAILALASVATVLWLASKGAAGAPLLAFEPRRPVPWNFIIVALVLAPALLSIAGGVFSLTSEPSPPDEGAVVALTAEDLWAFAFAYIALTATCFVVLAGVFRADRRDLGLPTTAAQLIADVRAGALGYLAALLPVYAIQAALMSLTADTEQHPILVQLQSDHSGALMAAAAMGAVVGAPLFEETAFRLIFQGWLEKHAAPANQAAADESLDAEPAALAPLPPESAAAEAPRVEGAVVADDPLEPATLSLADYLPDQPVNWAAIIVSSAVFAVAHLGHGVAPFSLFPLGLILGYLYQRTHRIVPSMVCHALFNSTTLVAVWAAGEQTATM